MGVSLGHYRFANLPLFLRTHDKWFIFRYVQKEGRVSRLKNIHEKRNMKRFPTKRGFVKLQRVELRKQIMNDMKENEPKIRQMVLNDTPDNLSDKIANDALLKVSSSFEELKNPKELVRQLGVNFDNDVSKRDDEFPPIKCVVSTHCSDKDGKSKMTEDM